MLLHVKLTPIGIQPCIHALVISDYNPASGNKSVPRLTLAGHGITDPFPGTGAISSVVEHCLHTAGVASSNLASPTISDQSVIIACQHGAWRKAKYKRRDEVTVPIKTCRDSAGIPDLVLDGDDRSHLALDSRRRA